MRYIKIKDNVQWKGWLEAKETINGYCCFACNDEPFMRMLLTKEHMEDLQLGIPKGYKITYRTMDEAQEMMARIAKLNGYKKFDE
ncbi:MAG: hypothetical protein K6A73_00860 [Bacteroidales bacterium]|nr:hypothetical protein [Bacteroidales bacterium]